MNRNHIIAYVVTAIITGAVMTLAGCRHSTTTHQCSGVVWNTTYSITYSSAVNLDDSIMSVMKRVEHSLSPFDRNSLVSAINRGESSATDTLLRRIFNASRQINMLSGGAFDPTVAPLVNLWGFGYDNASQPPTQAMIDSALSHVGISRCRIEADTIVKCSPATEFNFSAITKGYGCDLIGEMLRRNGSADYMVEIGGEIALSGHNPQGEPWHIQIDLPVEGAAPGSDALAVIELTDCGIATSGNYRNFKQSASGKTWHTIDPTTGRPAVSTTLSATVIARDCMTADALATACMAMTAEKALSMIRSVDGAEALLVESDGHGGFKTHASEKFPKPL